MSLISLQMNPVSRWISLSMIVMAFGVLFSSGALADSDKADSASINPLLDEKWTFWIGGFFPDVKSTIRLDSDTLPGEGINLENEFGLEDSKSVLWGGARWRISNRNQIEFEFNNLNRSGFVSATTRPFPIGEFVVQADASISTKFDLTLARLTYGYSIIKNDRHDLALKLGAHIASTEVAITATADIHDVNNPPPAPTLCEIETGSTPCTKTVESDEFTVPLPHFGISYSYAISPKWGFRTQLLGFAIKINDIKGTLAEVDLDLHYQAWEHVGLGLGFRYFDLTIKDEGDAFIKGELEYEYWGPAIYLSGNF